MLNLIFHSSGASLCFWFLLSVWFWESLNQSGFGRLLSWFLYLEELSQSLDCVAQESETCDLFWLSEPFAESLNAGLLAQERGQEKDCCDVRAFSHFFSRRRREGASPDGAGESDLCLYARWTGQPYDHVPDLCLTL